MTVVVEGRTRIRASADDRLAAECLDCGVHLQQQAQAGAGAALAAFDAHHPDAGGRPHNPRVPAGWLPAPTGPGALSQ